MIDIIILSFYFFVSFLEKSFCLHSVSRLTKSIHRMHSVPMDLDHDEVEALSMGLGLVINPQHLHHAGKHIVVLHPTTLKKMMASHKKGKHLLLKFKKGEGFWDAIKRGVRHVAHTVAHHAKPIVKEHLPAMAKKAGKFAGTAFAKMLAEKYDLDPEMAEKYGSMAGEYVGEKGGHHLAHNMGEGLRRHKHLRMCGGAVRAHSRHIVAPPAPSSMIQLGSPYARTNSPQMNPFFSNVNQNGGNNPLGRTHRTMSGGSFAPAGGGGLHHHRHRYVSI